MAFAPSALNIQQGRTVSLGEVARSVERARPDREHWILKLKGLNDRNAVEGLRGELLETPDGDVLREDDDSFFVYELIGLRVVTTAGEVLGTVIEVLQPGANDVYVVQGERGELLVPATAEVIERIDVSGGEISITPLAGMLDESK